MNATQDENRAGPVASDAGQSQYGDQSPGRILREGRLAHEYSVEDLCAQTKLSPRSIRALEEDDFEALSQPVFARGYYRQCAKVLDLDAERLMAAYNACAASRVSPQMNPDVIGSGVVPRDVTPGGSRSRGVLLAVLVIAVAAIVAIVYLMPSHKKELETLAGGSESQSVQTTTAPSGASATTADQTAGQVAGQEAGKATTGASADQQGMAGAKKMAAGKIAASGAPAAGSTGEATDGQQTANQTASQTGAASGANATGQATQGESTAAAGGSAAVPPNRLVLNFSQRSWVQVDDAKGARLLAGIFKSGDKKTVSGKLPYKVTIGVPDGVTVTIGGKPVNVAAQTSRSGVAHLTLNAPGVSSAPSSSGTSGTSGTSGASGAPTASGTSGASVDGG